MVRPSAALLNSRWALSFLVFLTEKPRLGVMENFCPVAPGLDPILSNNYAWFKSILSTVVLLVVYLVQRRQTFQKKLLEEIIIRMILSAEAGKSLISIRMVILPLQIRKEKQRLSSTFVVPNLQKVIARTLHFLLIPIPPNHTATRK
jgi:hypothetical protein